MSQLSTDGFNVVNDIAGRYGFSPDAVTHMLIAVHQGGGTQAQFNHFEFGGMGQWSQGGMIMIGDMFNNGLKAQVDSLCAELSNVLAQTRVFQPVPEMAMATSSQSQTQNGVTQSQGIGGMGGQSSLFVPNPAANWWPADLGQPGATGAQNDLRYAYFPMVCRLAVQVGGQVSVYDTGAHQISGFGQQQGGDQSITFTSQFGVVRLFDLALVSGGAQPLQGLEPVAAPEEPVATKSPEINEDLDAIFDSLTKLGELRDRGILTAQEFDDKKAELLSRL